MPKATTTTESTSRVDGVSVTGGTVSAAECDAPAVNKVFAPTLLNPDAPSEESVWSTEDANRLELGNRFWRRLVRVKHELANLRLETERSRNDFLAAQVASSRAWRERRQAARDRQAQEERAQRPEPAQMLRWEDEMPADPATVRYCLVQGVVPDDGLLPENQRLGPTDPMQFVARRVSEMAEFANKGSWVCYLERDERPPIDEFDCDLVEIPRRRTSRGQHWVQPVPSYCVLDRLSNLGCFSLNNFSNRTLAIKLWTASARVLGLRQSCVVLRPFEHKRIDVEFLGGKTADPRHLLVLYYTDWEDLQTMRREFGPEGADLQKYWAGKYELSVVIQGFRGPRDCPLKTPNDDMLAGVARGEQYLTEFANEWKHTNRERLAELELETAKVASDGKPRRVRKKIEAK